MLNAKKVGIFSALLVTLLWACSGAMLEAQTKPQTISLTIGAGHPIAGQPYVLKAHDFLVPEITKRVLDKTGIQIKWNEAYAGSIAKVAEVLEATESGLLQVGLVCLPFEPAKLFLHNLNYFVPFNTPDPIQATRITRRVFEEMPEMKEIFEKKYNQKFLGLGTVGNYQLLTTFAVAKLADLKGKKIAAAGPNLPLLTGTGAVPVQSVLTDAYTSIQTGVYQGWLVPPGSGYGFKLHEVAKNQANLDFGCVVVSVLTVNLDTWKNLPKNIQDIMMQVGREYEMKVAEEAINYDKVGLKAYVEKGVTIRDFPAAEREKWASNLPDVPNDKAKEADKMGLPGSKVMAAYIKYLEEDGYKLPRKWVIK